MGQLVVLHLLTLYIARLKRTLPLKEIMAMGRDLAHASQWVSETLSCEKAVQGIATKYFNRQNFLYLGRNLNYPVAMEGALKLKEISYIHAEGYPAGEMKHGPIALIDQNMPVVALAVQSKTYEKMLSNIEEAHSRGGEVLAVATEGDAFIREKAAQVVFVPKVPEMISPLITVVPLQLLAYYISVMRGCDVDQPRNLAKSVTVE
jgi:glucosamine--fructose-6-phosphate aminotransferase (isomerizing)